MHSADHIEYKWKSVSCSVWVNFKTLAGTIGWKGELLKIYVAWRWTRGQLSHDTVYILEAVSPMVNCDLAYQTLISDFRNSTNYFL